MKIHELPGDPGRQQIDKRRGRGEGSGLGTTAGKGHKGHQSRARGGKRGAFEGGQMPLVRRMPKRGFKNPFRTEYLGINLSLLEKHFENGATVDHAALVKAGIVSKAETQIKILGTGELTKKLTVRVSKFSESARKAIELKGGKAEEVN